MNTRLFAVRLYDGHLPLKSNSFLYRPPPIIAMSLGPIILVILSKCFLRGPLWKAFSVTLAKKIGLRTVLGLPEC